jgi:hypothetical protein
MVDVRKSIRALLIVAVYAICALRCEAQFIGYVSPQTVQNTLASNLACTGATQLFTTGVTANFMNIGQTEHQLTIAVTAGNPTFFKAIIQGIDRGGNVFQISDAMRLAQGQTNASLFAHGYYPQIQVSITCSTGTSFSAAYTGSSSDSGPILGASQIGQLAKVIAAVIPANASFTDLIQTPFGNAQGYLYVFPIGVLPAGSSLALTCSGNGNSQQYTLETFALPTFNTQFFYPIPPASCPFVSTTYTSGGASASNLSFEYDFVQPGSGNQTAFYSPSQLGVSALTEPAAGTSALSTIVDTRNVKEATLDFSCTAGAITVNVQTYNDDGTTTASIVSPLSAVAAATKTQLYIGSNVNPGSSGGTLSASAFVRFPQRALAFSFTNAGGAGTCTARLYMNY